MRWPPAISALLMVALAALVTAVAGPSAAAAESTDAVGAAQAVVDGIAPNGAGATLRAGLGPPAPLIAPVPASDVPPDRGTPECVHPAGVRVEGAPGRTGDHVCASRSGRGPPVAAAP